MENNPIMDGSPAPPAAPTPAAPIAYDYRLDDNLTRTQGRVFLTGTQALVRLLLAVVCLIARDSFCAEAASLTGPGAGDPEWMARLWVSTSWAVTYGGLAFLFLVIGTISLAIGLGR